MQGAFALVRGGSSSSNLLKRSGLAERAKHGEVFPRWLDCTEPSLTTALQGKQGVQALVRGGSRAANLLEPQHRRVSKV